MKRKAGLFSRLFLGSKKDRPTPTAGRRTLALEQLEPRILLDGITFSGTIKIDNGIPLREAFVEVTSVPVYYTDLKTGTRYETTLFKSRRTGLNRQRRQVYLFGQFQPGGRLQPVPP